MDKARIFFAGMLVLTLTSMTSAGAIATTNGLLGWTGDPTSDGMIMWPATLTMDFAGDYQTAEVELDSPMYSETFTLTDDGMTSIDQRFFGDGEAQIRLTMDPLNDLDNTSVFDITDMHFRWAHPDFNDVAPVSWLEMSGDPMVIIPEPSAVILIALAAMLCLAIGIPRR